MGWKDLLRTRDIAVVILPWVGGRQAQWGQRIWKIDGKLPREYGWYEFHNNGSRLILNKAVDPAPEMLTVSGMAGAIGTKARSIVKGYLVGDRLVPDTVRVDEDPVQLASNWNTVHLVDDELDRFARIQAGRTHEDGPLIYMGQEMSFGPEMEVTQAYEDKRTSLDDIKGVPPALETAFRFEVWRREEEVKYRAELVRKRREEEERRRLEERRAAIAEQIGTAEGRREMVPVDFGEAATAALQLSNAEYLDHQAMRNGEYKVNYRYMNRRFQCVCDSRMRIVDSGICLTDHATGINYDNVLSLESLPLVVKEAIDRGKLVVYRHVGGYGENDYD